MSYSISLVTPKRQKEKYWVNYTANIASVAHEAFEVAGLQDWQEQLQNKPAAECQPYFEKAIAEVEARLAYYSLRNPSNGWGSASGWLRVLGEILEALKAHPKCLFNLSA